MLNVSGYGILMDEYSSELPNYESSLIDIDDYEDYSKREKLIALKNFSDNIKSRLILQNENDIIASKMYSIRHSLFEKFHKYKNITTPSSVYTVHYCNSNHESNLYPIRNFDLLDIDGTNDI